MRRRAPEVPTERAAYRRAVRALSRTSLARCSRSTTRSRFRRRCGSCETTQEEAVPIAHIARSMTRNAAAATVTSSVIQHHAQQRRMIVSPPLYSMKPSSLNLFMKKLTRERVVPTISASTS